MQNFSLKAVHPGFLCDYSENSVAARSEAWVFGRTLAGIAGSNPAGEHGCLVLCEFCVLSGSVVPASRLSLVQRSPTECGVSGCDLGN